MIFLISLAPLMAGLQPEPDNAQPAVSPEEGQRPSLTQPPGTSAPSMQAVDSMQAIKPPADPIIRGCLAVVDRQKKTLTTLGFVPGVTHESPEVLDAADLLDAVRQVDPDPKDELPEARGWRLAERKRRIKAALRIDGPRGLLFGPRGGQVTYLSPLVSDLLQARINRLRATLPCPFQEERIAQELGLLFPGESIAEAMERVSA